MAEMRDARMMTEDTSEAYQKPSVLVARWALNPIHIILLTLVVRSARRVWGFIQRRGLSEFLQRRGARFYVGCFLYVLMVCFDPYPGRGGYPVGWFTRLLRNAPWWKWLARYFPMEMRKSVEISASRKCIFVCHPHGVLGFGTWLNFGMNATGIANLFPGRNFSTLGASAWFWIPVVREFLMLHGFGSVRRKDVLSVLNNGSSAVLNVGGAREALDARPGTFHLQLRRRKGFVKIALEAGANLVPVISFGENELYSMYATQPGTFLRGLQENVTSLTGSTLPLFCGVPWFPAFPRKSRIITIVGEPIEVNQIHNYSAKDVDALHARYIAQVEILFETHKVECGFPDLRLIMPS